MLLPTGRRLPFQALRRLRREMPDVFVKTPVMVDHSQQELVEMAYAADDIKPERDGEAILAHRTLAVGR